MNDHTLETITHHYLSCALWTMTGDDENEHPGDSLSIHCDLSPDVWKQAREDVADFVSLLTREGVEWSAHWSPEQFGHDFWLTRNGHGAGFWDRYGSNNETGYTLGQILTKWAQTYSGIDLYVGDDGKVYA